MSYDNSFGVLLFKGSCFDVCRHIPHFIKSCVSINKECDISLDDWAGKFGELVNVK